MGCQHCNDGIIGEWDGYGTQFCECELGRRVQEDVFADWSRQQAAEIEAERRNEMILAGVVEYDEEATRDAIQCGIDYGVYDENGNDKRYATEEEFYRGVMLDPEPDVDFINSCKTEGFAIYGAAVYQMDDCPF